MKATARAHPIQGLVKYHGLRDPELRVPYHDSISVCTAPSHTRTTVEFDPDRRVGEAGADADAGGADEAGADADAGGADEAGADVGAGGADVYVVDGERVTGRAAERIRAVVDHVRARAGLEHPVRFESVNEVPANIGFGSSSSGFAAAATALCAAADLDLSRPELSTVARRGSTSAARAVTGAFSHLRAGNNDADCRSERIRTPLEEDLRIVAAEVPAFKHTEHAHEEAAESHMFGARLAHVHGQIADMRDALRRGDFHDAFELAEHDSLSLAATTMTGPSGWVYWQPDTLRVFERVRDLRETGVPAYFSVDTGASVYVNTTREHVDRVEESIGGITDTRIWEVGGPAEVLDDSEALF